MEWVQGEAGEGRMGVGVKVRHSSLMLCISQPKHRPHYATHPTQSMRVECQGGGSDVLVQFLAPYLHKRVHSWSAKVGSLAVPAQQSDDGVWVYVRVVCACACVCAYEMLG